MDDKKQQNVSDEQLERNFRIMEICMAFNLSCMIFLIIWDIWRIFTG